MTYNESIEYLENLMTFGIKPGLKRITRLLELLDQPHKKYKTIHVTGTNGKGSVCAFLSQILKDANIKAGMFTSPHLMSYCERIKVDGIDISEDDFAKLVEQVKTCISIMTDSGYESPTEFEVLTAMAFKYFADKKVEYAVIEVGLGGLLDSTNVITPEVCVITNVANDHADKCGGDLRGIAMHKAGIIKPGVTVVTAAAGEALDIIHDAAEAVDAEVYDIDSENVIEAVNIPMSLKGAYQMTNAMLAMLAAQILMDYRITPDITTDALMHTKWAGRFEIFKVNGKQIVIDGAHNGAGTAALRMSLDKEFPTGRRTFLFGVLKDKDIDVMIDNLFTEQDFVIVTKPNSVRAAEPEDIVNRLKDKSIDAIAIDDNAEAFHKFINSDSELLIAAGSLYLIGNIRNMLINFSN
ncbi:MAG: bifunctional folylpolyglutamate synthase/dihydrofolate synthase [Selenomonadaceae bacterium]|nr:bifunctional folylpolyglutamate synthase/dihydrofolate synthase [Selenomonadaceae bacterium]MBR1859920.1 bifunctional folylpolyglutamate synthase/dihydrofolate synthase [Selenomonadaceae bacterium]